jgi:ERCC4-type nuclease
VGCINCYPPVLQRVYTNSLDTDTSSTGRWSVILLDDRSGSVELAPLLPPELVKIERLQFGDAAFTGNGPGGVDLIGIERKGLHDFINSADSGRLQGHQLPGLLASYNHVYIILEGLWRPGDNGMLEEWRRGGWQELQKGSRRYPTSLIDNLLNTLSVVTGVIVRQTSNQKQTASLIHHLYLWWQKDWEKHRGYVGFNVPPAPVSLLRKPSLVRRIAKELPLIGWERSDKVAKRFPTVASMLLADEKEWREVEGIGKVLANAVVKSIWEER